MVRHAKAILIIILFLAGLPLGTRAQALDPIFTSDQPIAPPPILNGQGPSLVFESEKGPRNSVFGGISFTDAFTDNMYMSSTNTESTFSYLLQPYIGIAQSTSRLNWDASFATGFFFYQHLGNENQWSKNVVVDLSYRLTEQLNLRLSDTFSDTSGLFSAANPVATSSGIGVVEQSNNSLLLSPVQRTVGNSSLGELSYQLSPDSEAGVRGTFTLLDYPGSSSDSSFGPLYNSLTYSGEAFYNQRLSLRQWLGASVRVQTIDTQPWIGRTNTASLLLYYGAQLRPGTTLSFFAGPEYYDSSRPPDMVTSQGLFYGHQWTPALGATFNWQGESTSAFAAYSRQVSDGGGLYSAVTLQQENAALRCQLSERQAVTVGFTHSDNEPLGTAQNYSSLSASANLEHLLTRNLVLRLGYARQRQELPYSQQMASANLAWVSVTYNFMRAFGR
ncbi:MAG: hypothetical protein WBR26_13800 [Candidatus Acidiferrum sp.]